MEEIRKGVSVIVCCFNSSARLPETIKHLALQKVPKHIPWEIIVINNASTDNTVKVAKEEWEKYSSSTAFRIVEQNRSGLSYARDKGIEVAEYEFCIFCDDDNWLDEDYLRIAYEEMVDNPRIGALGGQCEGVYEIKLKPSLLPMREALAIGTQHTTSGRINKNIYGAGMVVRKSCYNFLARYSGGSLLEDRKGKQLTSGGDTEMCWKILFAGYDIFYSDSLLLRHYMPKERLSSRYYFKLCLTNVKPVVILGQYFSIYQNPEHCYSIFFIRTILAHLKHSFYFFPRCFLGRYKFHSVIYFLQSTKVILLMMKGFIEYRKIYKMIKQMKKDLKTYV